MVTLPVLTTWNAQFSQDVEHVSSNFISEINGVRSCHNIPFPLQGEHFRNALRAHLFFLDQGFSASMEFPQGQNFRLCVVREKTQEIGMTD